MWGKILFVLLEWGSYIQHHGKSKVSSIFREKTSFGFTEYNGILSVFDDNIVHGKLVEDCGYQRGAFQPNGLTGGRYYWVNNNRWYSIEYFII